MEGTSGSVDARSFPKSYLLPPRRERREVFRTARFILLAEALLDTLGSETLKFTVFDSDIVDLNGLTVKSPEP